MSRYQSSLAITTASDIPNVPAGAIAATNVQTAINELDTEKAALAGATFTGAIAARINLRISTVADSATPTPNGDTTDQYTVTALAQAAAFGVPTGTPVDGQKLTIRIKDNATARALSWNAIYRAGTDIALPTTTVISKTMYVGFIYNSADSKWDLVASMGNI